MGKRKIEIDGNFYISGEDAEIIKEGIQIRLLGLGNIPLQNKGTLNLKENLLKMENMQRYFQKFNGYHKKQHMKLK